MTDKCVYVTVAGVTFPASETDWHTEDVKRKTLRCHQFHFSFMFSSASLFCMTPLLLSSVFPWTPRLPLPLFLSITIAILGFCVFIHSQWHGLIHLFLSELPSAYFTFNCQLSPRLSVLVEQLRLAAAQEGVDLLDSDESRGADLIGCCDQTQLCYSNNAPTVGTAGTGYATVHTQTSG